MNEKSFLLVLLLIGVALTAEEDGSENPLQEVNSDCALTIPKHEDSAAFQGNDATGQSSSAVETCISLSSLQTAMDLSNEQFPLSEIANSTNIETVMNQLGNFIVETSRIIADNHSLSNADIFEQLPLLDTRNTEMFQFCPEFLKFPECEEVRFRSHDGTCNNLRNPHWGATHVAYRRMLPPRYADGVSRHRVSVLGDDLPSVRLISATFHHDFKAVDRLRTALFNVWGQAVAHDISFAAITRGDPGVVLNCCDTPSDGQHPECLPISVPPQDPFFSRHNQSCLEFIRAAAGLREECKLGPFYQRNSVTSFLDASLVYGSTTTVADNLRTGSGGLLRSFSLPSGLKELPLVQNDQRCTNEGIGCAFIAGDARANLLPNIAIMHTVLLREHNRIAKELGKINQKWDDEKVYQEARRIVAAIIQHITYNEYLPMVLGKDPMEEHDLIIRQEGFYDGYDPDVEATLPTEFALAYRFGHSLAPPTMHRWSVDHKFLSAHRLRDHFLNTEVLLKPGELDLFVSGLLNQKIFAMDRHVNEEMTNFLFRSPNTSFGHDLASINMQRSRDLGVATYNDVREMCGLERANEWRDLTASFSNTTLQLFAKLYKTPHDLDLWSAGIAEKRRPGSLLGRVLGCVVARTFSALRRGDKFWYENSGFPSSFTLEQLNEIRKVKLSTLICVNTDTLKTIQEFAMVGPDPELNPRISCDSPALSRMDLTKWSEA